MNIYLMRHGLAKPEEEDLYRGLAIQGWYDTQKTACWLADKNPDISVIYYSNKLRAQQTAHITAETLGKINTLKICSDLGPNDPVAPWLRRLETETRSVMIIGHLPFLPKLASLLVQGTEDDEFIAIRPSGIVCLGKSGDAWAIEWQMGAVSV